MTETELLFTEILKCSRPDLYLNRNLHLDKDSASFISLALRRRISGEPLQYILGKTEFMGLEFRITPDVFIPRPETELLVEEVVKIVSCAMCHVSSVNILDIGTGSGCIAVSLAKSLPGACIDAMDISEKALEIAKSNAKLNNVNINFIKSDLFASRELGIASYDIIVSNPPYIPTPEIDKLQPEISYEPRIALDGGEDGLNYYRRIISEAAPYLHTRGLLIMEIGCAQLNKIKDIFKKQGNFKIQEVVKDYNSINRVVVARVYNANFR